jgi:diguanylate cyclase (GGDEF)-like protein
MMKGWKRLRSLGLRDVVRALAATSQAGSKNKDPGHEEELLGAVWEALNVARDNKALIVAKEGTIINVNRLGCELCERSLDQLVGKNVSLELFEVPPPQVEGIARWETALTTASGNSIAVEVTCQPIGCRLQDIQVYAIRDLRERQEAAAQREHVNTRLEQQHLLLMEQERQLRVQNVQLDAALNNIAQGVAMFDAEYRLVLCNTRYVQIYGLRQEQVQYGTTLRQIIEHRISNGLLSDKAPEHIVDSMLRQRNDGTLDQFLNHLNDGRCIAVTIQPMADGGTVTMHQDITEHKKLIALLEEQNLRFDAALENMSQGLCMFDADQRLVVANDRYAEMYDLTPDQVKPGTTFRQILESRIAMGAYVGSTPDAYIGERLAAVREPNASTKIQELADGRVFAILHQPMANGGWVATHQDITEQRRAEAKIAHMAMHDGLTTLPNRLLLNERLELALTRAKRDEMVAAHLLDLDHFKNVNDTLGHAAGDKLLRMVADRLRALVRETDTIARMGGDEFAVVQVTIAQPSDATVLAQRIIEVVSEPYEIDGHQVIIGTSVGIAVGPADGSSPDQLMRNADLALYRAKGKGRGMYRFFEPEMDTQMQARRVMEIDLRKALTGGEFELHYQPVVNLERSQISGFEALIRWHHPEKGMISPGEFIPLAEENGFIVQLGEWALRNACATAAGWPGDLKIAVNLSPVQFRNPGLVQVVFSALATSGLQPARLELEITETVLLEDNEATLATLYQLRELGVRIAMDDFGTGYSSLSYLQRFPFDKIKIDRSFIKGMADGVGSLNIVRAVAALANGLGMTTTAEGVETQEQRDAVQSEGCTEMQGFLFSKPLPASEIERLFLRKNERKEQAKKDAA